MKTVRMIMGLLVLVMTVAVLPVMADAPVEGRIGRAEVRFMEGMIDHHQMAIDMALDCSAREDVSDTCEPNVRRSSTRSNRKSSRCKLGCWHGIT